LKDDRYRIQASFLGLHGTDSPLPTYYLDEIAYENAHGIGLRPAFLNFFNHRLHTLLHQGWRKYRYYVRFQPGAKDGFSRYVFALIGLDDSALRGATPLSAANGCLPTKATTPKRCAATATSTACNPSSRCAQ